MKIFGSNTGVNGKKTTEMNPIFISGASGTLGLSVAEYFSLNGYRIIGTYSSEKPDRRLPETTWLHWKSGDLQLTALLTEALMEESGIQAWFHFSGSFWGGFLAENTPAGKIRAQTETNFLSAAELCPVVLPLLNKETHSAVVFIGAQAGLEPAPQYAAYGASKAALIHFSQSLAKEYSGTGIRVNTLVPTTIDTPANRKQFPEAGFTNWIQIQEMISVLGFLLSDGASAVNGSVIRLER